MKIPHYLNLPTPIIVAITQLENETNWAPHLIHEETVKVFESLVEKESRKAETRINRLQFLLSEFKNIYPEFPK